MHRLLVIALGSILLMFGFRSALSVDETPLASKSPAKSAPQSTSTQDDPGGALVLHRSADGQFHLSADLNDQPVRFLVDTGADVVALSARTAEGLGIAPSPDAFEPIMRTASGTGNAAPIMLDRLRIGELELRNVEAVVIEGLDTDLLGQNVLRRMGHVSLSGDRMVIQPG